MGPDTIPSVWPQLDAAAPVMSQHSSSSPRCSSDLSSLKNLHAGSSRQAPWHSAQVKTCGTGYSREQGDSWPSSKTLCWHSTSPRFLGCDEKAGEETSSSSSYSSSRRNDNKFESINSGRSHLQVFFRGGGSPALLSRDSHWET